MGTLISAMGKKINSATRSNDVDDVLRALITKRKLIDFSRVGCKEREKFSLTSECLELRSTVNKNLVVQLTDNHFDRIVLSLLLS